MWRIEGFALQAADCLSSSELEGIHDVDRKDALNLRSVLKTKVIGWGRFYIYGLLESIHAFLIKHVLIDEETVPIALIFIGICVLRGPRRIAIRYAR
jgi:hypothetical protein